MKNTENVYEKITPISIRLSAHGKERLNRLQKESGCKSQKEFIETLLHLYENSGMQKLSPEASSTIKLILQNNNWITNMEEHNYKEADSLVFDGVCLYAPQQPNRISKLSVLSCKAIECIKRDFLLSDEIDIEKYLVQDTMCAYYSYTNRKYIILECFLMYQYLNENEILGMYKEVNGAKNNSCEVGNMVICKHTSYEIKDFTEFLGNIKPYMNTTDIINIDFVIKKHKMDKNAK